MTATSDRRYLKVVPEWFDLKKYECAVALDAENWTFQIAVRFACFHHLGVMRSPEPYLPEWDAPILKALASLRSNPIVVRNSPPFDHKVFSWCYETPAAAVRPMTRLDLYSIDRRVRQGLTRRQIEHIQWLVMHESPAAFLAAETTYLNVSVEEDCDGLFKLPMMIDLRFPNKILREHFEIYLQRMRRRGGGRPSEASKKSPDLAKWGSVQLLPCIDLLLWEKEQDGRIPDSVLVKAYGPKGQVDREMIRKTIRPLAEALLSSHGFPRTRLGALAHSELAERTEAARRRNAKLPSNIASARTRQPG